MLVIRIPIEPIREYPVQEDKLIEDIRDILKRYGYSDVIAVLNEKESEVDNVP
jgi:hypothetical protein